MATALPSFPQLSDQQLLDTVRRLADEERHATAALIRSLIELDTRRLYLGEGFPSLFAYCTQVLRLSEHGAYNRIEVARAGRKHPRLLDALEAADITLAAARLVGPHLTLQNCDAVLAAARHRSKREVEALVATLRPLPDAPAIVRRLPAPVVTPASAPQPPPGTAAILATAPQPCPATAPSLHTPPCASAVDLPGFFGPAVIGERRPQSLLLNSCL